MTWDNSLLEKMITERLLLSSPEEVYRRLEEYGDFLKKNNWSIRENLEKALLSRNDKLINLGLAQFAGTKEIVLELYEKTKERDIVREAYNKAIRLACLSNVVTTGLLSSFLEKVDIQELINAQAYDEIAIYLANPTAPENQLINFLKRNGAFANLELVLWMQCVYQIAKNPRLNKDRSNIHGPDLQHWDLHKAIFSMLEQAPAPQKSFHAIKGLIQSLNPNQVCHPEAIQPVLDYWKNIELKDYQGNLETGDYTKLNARDEFLCLVASLYGKGYKSQKPKIFGSLKSDDIILRCAYYGNANMTLKEMEEAYSRDEEVFCYTALNNSSFYYDKKCRKFLEANLGGRLSFLYQTRCNQFNAENKFFDPRPLSDQFWDFEDNPPIDKKSDELAAIEKMVSQQTKLIDQFAHLKTLLYWGGIILMCIISYRNH